MKVTIIHSNYFDCKYYHYLNYYRINAIFFYKGQRVLGNRSKPTILYHYICTRDFIIYRETIAASNYEIHKNIIHNHLPLLYNSNSNPFS